MAKHGNDGLKVLKQLRQDKDSGKIVRKFEDEFFALDLLKVAVDSIILPINNFIIMKNSFKISRLSASRAYFGRS